MFSVPGFEDGWVVGGADFTLGKVGIKEGLRVGDLLGSGVGKLVGEAVGGAVGFAVGWRRGSVVGNKKGALVVGFGEAAVGAVLATEGRDGVRVAAAFG